MPTTKRNVVERTRPGTIRVDRIGRLPLRKVERTKATLWVQEKSEWVERMEQGVKKAGPANALAGPAGYSHGGGKFARTGLIEQSSQGWRFISLRLENQKFLILAWRQFQPHAILDILELQIVQTYFVVYSQCPSRQQTWRGLAKARHHIISRLDTEKPCSKNVQMFRPSR
jgi:hypothetical protein